MKLCPQCRKPLAPEVLADLCPECLTAIPAVERDSAGTPPPAPLEGGLAPPATPVSGPNPEPDTASSPPLPPGFATEPASSVPPVIRVPPVIAAAPGSGFSPPVAARRISPVVFLLLGLLLSGVVLGIFINGELGSFLSQSWEVAALALMCVLAYAGIDRPVARVFSWLLLGVALLGGIITNLALAYLSVTGGFPEKGKAGALAAGVLWLMVWIFVASALAATSALLAWLGGFRRFCGALSGNQEWTSVRILALAAVVSLTLVFLVPLTALGAPPLLSAIQHSKDPMTFFDDGRGAAGQLRDEMYSLCWTLLAAVLAVGYGVSRNWRETLDRLGLKRISIKQTGVAVALIAVLWGLSSLADLGITYTWQRLHWPTTDMAAFEALFAPFISPLGAVVVGISAGVGEEVAVRGILQPRLGLLLSNLFFTSLHAYQYHWDGLLSVFLLGLAFGLIRKRSSTTVSAIVHGGYDFVLAILAT